MIEINEKGKAKLKIGDAGYVYDRIDGREVMRKTVEAVMTSLGDIRAETEPRFSLIFDTAKDECHGFALIGGKICAVERNGEGYDVEITDCTHHSQEENGRAEDAIFALTDEVLKDLKENSERWASCFFPESKDDLNEENKDNRKKLIIEMLRYSVEMQEKREYAWKKYSTPKKEKIDMERDREISFLKEKLK